MTTRDIRSMLGSNNDGNMTSLSKSEVPDFPNPPREFGMETRDDFLSKSCRLDRRSKREEEFGMESRDDFLSRSSRSDRRSKRDDGSTPPPRNPKSPNRHRQGKSTSTSSDVKRQGRGENTSAVSNSSRRSNSRHISGAKNRRERSQTLPRDDNPDCETGAFDYTPLTVGSSAGCDEESSEANFSSSASALSKLLGTTTSAITVPVNNTSTSPRKMKSPKKMTTNENDADGRATTAKPKVTIVGKAKVYSRSLIPPKVYHSSATGLWISTVNTSSNSSDDVKAFSFRTEQEARASAYANAPPVMIPFDNCSECMLCDNKFSLLRRRKNCRNCGICICTNFSCR